MNTDLSLRNRPDLATKRLLLRRPDDRDVDVIVSVVGDWEVARRLARVPHPYNQSDARFFLDHVVPAEWVWAVTLSGADKLLGTIGLTPEQGTDAAELGYWLAPTHWGTGITTEAAKAVVAFGFEHLGLPVITSGYFEDNHASGRVLRKLGFMETGHVMRPSLAAGGEVPSIRMVLANPTRDLRRDKDGNASFPKSTR